MSAVITQPKNLTREELISKLDGPLKSIFDPIDQQMAPQRLSQIALAERNYLYLQGKQYLVPRMNGMNRTIGWVSAVNDRSRKKPKFASVYNIIYADGVTFISVVGQRPPNMKAVADDPSVDESVDRAKINDIAIRHLHRQWNLKSKRKQLAFHLWTTGPVFAWPRYVSKGHVYGWEDVPIIGTEDMTEPDGYRCPECGEKSPQMMCPECGTQLGPQDYEGPVTVTNAVEKGSQRYPKGSVELGYYNTFHVSTPNGCKEIGDCDWLDLRTMEQDYQIKAQYEELAGGQVDTGSDDETAVEASEALNRIESPDGTQLVDYKNKIEHQRRWITPIVYHAFGLGYRKYLEKEFEDGLMFARVGAKLVRVEKAKLPHAWSVCKTGTGEFINSAPLCQVAITIQDDINSLVNMGKEVVLRSIPRTLIDGSLLDEDPNIDKPAIIGELIRTKLSGNQNLGNMMKELPTARFSDQLVPMVEFVRRMSREADFIQPILSGGGEQFSTWRAGAQARNQALMQLEPSFSEMQTFDANSTENGLRELAKYGSGTMTVAPAKASNFSAAEELDLSMLNVEGVHVEPAETVPMGFAEKVTHIGELSTENPMLAASVGLGHPMNVSQTQEMFGIPEFYAPGENEQESALGLIRDLLQEEPMDDIDPMTGQLMQVPSIQPDPFLHKNAQLFAEIFRTWCLSKVGGKTAGSNPRGFENVRLFGMALDQMAMAALMPAPVPGAGPEGAPPPGGGPGPKKAEPETQIPPIPGGPGPGVSAVA